MPLDSNHYEDNFGWFKDCFHLCGIPPIVECYFAAICRNYLFVE